MSVDFGSTAAGEGGGDTARDAVAQARRWYWQRISAMVLALCVVVHLALVVYAVRGGLSAAEILGRTRGHAGWAAFYGVFVVAAAIHVPAGIGNVVHEWLGVGRRNAWRVGLAAGVLVFVLGARAVLAVVAPGAST